MADLEQPTREEWPLRDRWWLGRVLAIGAFVAVGIAGVTGRLETDQPGWVWLLWTLIPAWALLAQVSEPKRAIIESEVLRFEGILREDEIRLDEIQGIRRREARWGAPRWMRVPEGGPRYVDIYTARRRYELAYSGGVAALISRLCELDPSLGVDLPDEEPWPMPSGRPPSDEDRHSR